MKFKARRTISKEFDATSDQVVTQVTKQENGRIRTRNMGSRGDNQCCHNHLLDVAEHFL